MSRPPIAALGLALAIFLADQASKLWVLAAVPAAGRPLEVAPFMHITLVWNRGISYGLLQQDGLGRWLLVAVTVGAIVFLAAWAWRAERLSVRLALGAILGGAVGNLVDRIVYGAVVDFVHLFYAGFSWYVFNIADAAIVVGVAALLAESLLRPSTARREA